METKAHYVLVGFFAIALTAAAALYAVWQGKASFDRQFEEYDVVFQGPVRGLTNASEVRFNGIVVGGVTQLGIDPLNTTNVIARIRVDAETTFKTDSVAQLEPQGLTGLAYIQVSAGAPTAGLLRDAVRSGSARPQLPSRQAQLEYLIEGGSDIVEYATESLLRLNALFSDENLSRLSLTMANLSEVSAALAEHSALAGEARSAIAQLDAAAAEIERAATEMSAFAIAGDAFLRESAEPMTRETELAAIAVAQAAVEATAILEETRGPITRFAGQGLDEMSIALSNLRGLIAALEAVAVAIEDNPARFVAGARRSEVELPR